MDKESEKILERIKFTCTKVKHIDAIIDSLTESQLKQLLKDLAKVVDIEGRVWFLK